MVRIQLAIMWREYLLLCLQERIFDMDAPDHTQGAFSCSSHRLRLHGPLSVEWTSVSMSGLLALGPMLRMEVTDKLHPLLLEVR